MDNTAAPSHKTELKDRTLWFDGDSSFDANNLLHLKAEYKVRFVDQMNDLVLEYNKHVPRGREIKVKKQCGEINVDWTIPDRYKTLNIEQWLVDAHEALMGDCDQTEFDKRELRLCQEIVKYKKLDLLDVLRAILWIINRLTANNIVWGVGRGSSVSSYVLYVIGVHDVDSFSYGLNIDDFLHE